MSRASARVGFVLLAAMGITAFAGAANAQQTYPKPTDLPNPDRLAEGWPTIPASMNGGKWGEVIRVHVHKDGNIWVFHRCFNTVPSGPLPPPRIQTFAPRPTSHSAGCSNATPLGSSRTSAGASPTRTRTCGAPADV